MSLLIYIFLMAGTTYLIRMIPFVFFTKKIHSRFLKSFLYYVPAAVLSAMTFPAIFYATGNTMTAICGTAVALVLAFCKQSLLVVALSAAAVAFATSFIF